MATKVEFKRVETDAEVENIDIKDGQLIYTGTGKTYMDYGNQRIPTGSGGSSVTVDTEMSDTSENAVQNKVIKEYVDNQISIGSTEPTDDENKIWIDTSSLSQSDNTNMKYNDNGTYKDIYVKAFDTLPVGAEVDYDGSTVPDGWTEVTQGYTLLDKNIYYKKVGKMVTLFRPARNTSGGFIGDEISLSEYNYTNLNASNKLLPSDLRPTSRIGFAVFAHTTDNQILTRCYGEIMETGYISIYNWGTTATLNRLAFCVTYMVD